MTQSSKADRPSEVALAGWLTVISSIALILTSFDRIGRLRSIESREGMERCWNARRMPSDCGLTRPFLEGLGLDVEGALSVLQTLLVVTGGLAAAAAILGWYALQRNNHSRIALTALAVPLFVVGMASSSVLALLVAISSGMLWSGPARDWFAGRPVRKPARVAAPPARRPGPPVGPPVGPPDAASRVSPPDLPPVPTGLASDAPPPYAGFGAPRPGAPYAASGARPPALVAAVVITWLASAAVLVVFGISLVLVLADPSAVRDVMEQQPRIEELGLTVDEVRSVLVAMAVLFVGWALAAAFLAVLVMLRVAWARPLLIASAIASGLLSFVMVAAFIPVVTAVAGMVSAYLLLRPEVGQWVNRR